MTKQLIIDMKIKLKCELPGYLYRKEKKSSIKFINWSTGAHSIQNWVLFTFLALLMSLKRGATWFGKNTDSADL